jgi:hypothetical protein
MRARAAVAGLVLGIALGAGPADAIPVSPSAVVVDRGLHRQWIVVRDDAHPERPPRLVEVPWSDARAERGQSEAPQARAHRDAPLVRPGMTVVVAGGGSNAEWHLTGIALEAGWSGDTVLFRAGLHGAARRGIVRGPALVEWLPGKAGN